MEEIEKNMKNIKIENNRNLYFYDSSPGFDKDKINTRRSQGIHGTRN